jgi:hypothetical protein
MKIIFISFFILLVNFSFPKETLGLVTKSKGKVEYQKFDSNKFTSNFKKGLGLYGDDQIRTGDNGFSIYRYLDDASSIKILKNSEVIIQGRVDSRKITKNIEVSNGVLNFNIDQQNDGYFTVITPTSVATVKGTQFWLICNGVDGDKFLGVEGSVEVKNIESGQRVILNENSTVVSTSNGNIVTQNMTTDDFQQVDDLNDESGEYEDFDIDTGFNDNNPDSDSNTDSDDFSTIRIEFEDSLGNSKEVIIKYK